MWKDNDDKIMGILDSIETQNKGCFPVVCPICGEKDGHLYFHRNRDGDEKGSMWVWCGKCYHLHMLCAVCLNGGKIWIK